MRPRSAPPSTWTRAADPEEVEWEVWGTLPDSVLEYSGTGAVPRIKTIPAYRGVVAVSIGPYGNSGHVYERVLGWMETKGLKPAGPIHELYLSDPAEVPEEALQTEIRVVVAG